MMGNLIENIKDPNTDLRIIVIASEGSVFSAGHNLKEIVSYYNSKNCIYPLYNRHKIH